MYGEQQLRALQRLLVNEFRLKVRTQGFVSCRTIHAPFSTRATPILPPSRSPLHAAARYATGKSDLARSSLTLPSQLLDTDAQSYLANLKPSFWNKLTMLFTSARQGK